MAYTWTFRDDMHPAVVSVIIVNYRGERYLHELLRSLCRQTFQDFEVVLVDNGVLQGDAPVEAIAAQYPLNLRVVTNRANVGFCEGNNVGIRYARGEYVLFLNNDTYVDDRWLEVLVNRVASHDDSTAAVSAIVNPRTGTAAYGGLYDVYGSAFINRRAATPFFYGEGASLLVPKRVLDRVGPYDSALFMYQDDVDLCWRIRLAGYTVICASQSKCYHHNERTAPAEILEANRAMPIWKFYHAHAKNRIRVLVKNYAFRNVVKRLPRVLALIALRGVVLAALNRDPAYLRAVVRGFAWNLRNLRDTLRERRKVQVLRRIDDAEIEKHMLQYPIELTFRSLAAAG